MLRAIELAKEGVGKVNPNPLVGAVIVRDGEILSEGYHARYGELHAERHAFSRLENPEAARGSQMYVTLEPCCHQGKQPPCTQAIIDHGIRKVYVGSDDPNVLVAGKGIALLRQAGVEVETQVMKEACDALNPVFFHYITEKTPYVVMKYAMTLDGKIACDSGKSQWVTGERARNHVQETRNALAGIMAGIGTVLADDPSLTCRMPGGRNPIRIIADSHLRIPLESKIVQTAGEVATIVAATEEGCSKYEEKRYDLEKLGVRVLAVPGGTCPEGDGHVPSAQNRVDLNALMKILGSQGIDGILLEGGAALNQSALWAGIVQKIQVYVAPKIFGGGGAFTPVRGLGVEEPSQAFLFRNRRITDFGEDILLEYEMCKK
ncbi:MAG: bifunctional diaminohydroxyphosphoribosylaminopyrimidine deaminase/5-amino-6-(5-phosphoribosylamino)uracil reductase RibD [Lachnospiraceae bacterium]|nr:bifunctional diaminohydroxyphosphoribosylaminopyrimidine deaminase/5-amino-6-(5-phosphoribosylamino)uracil reductase RibD [Lachnospiraceae bacterium]